MSHWIVVLPLMAAGCVHTGRNEVRPEPVTAASRQASSFARPLRTVAAGVDESDRQSRQESAITSNMRRGLLEIENGRFDQAVRFFERVLRDDPQHVEAHHRLAILSDLAGDYSTAERHYLAALENRPHDARLLNDLGYSYLLQGRLSESEQLLRDAVDADPTHALAVNNLGLLYETLGDEDRAAAIRRLSPTGRLDAPVNLTPQRGEPGSRAAMATDLITRNDHLDRFPTREGATSNRAAAIVAPPATVAQRRLAAGSPERPGLIEPHLPAETVASNRQAERETSEAYVRQDRQMDRFVDRASAAANIIAVDTINKATAGIESPVRDLPLWTASPDVDSGMPQGRAVLPAGWHEEVRHAATTDVPASHRRLPPPVYASTTHATTPEPARSQSPQVHPLPPTGHSL